MLVYSTENQNDLKNRGNPVPTLWIDSINKTNVRDVGQEWACPPRFWQFTKLYLIEREQIIPTTLLFANPALGSFLHP